MANRFAKQKKDLTILRSILLPVLLFVIIVGFFQLGIDRLNATTEQEQLRAAKEAVTRAVVQCYALEGQYPPDMEYLVDHYGLMVDQESYIIHYQMFASNLMPDIDVLPRYF